MQQQQQQHQFTINEIWLAVCGKSHQLRVLLVFVCQVPCFALFIFFFFLLFVIHWMNWPLICLFALWAIWSIINIRFSTSNFRDRKKNTQQHRDFIWITAQSATTMTNKKKTKTSEKKNKVARWIKQRQKKNWINKTKTVCFVHMVKSGA